MTIILKTNYFTSLLNFINVWTLFNSNIFIYKLQNRLNYYIIVSDFYQIRFFLMFENTIDYITYGIYFFKYWILLVLFF